MEALSAPFTDRLAESCPTFSHNFIFILFSFVLFGHYSFRFIFRLLMNFCSELCDFGIIYCFVFPARHNSVSLSVSGHPKLYTFICSHVAMNISMHFVSKTRGKIENSKLDKLVKGIDTFKYETAQWSVKIDKGFKSLKGEINLTLEGDGKFYFISVKNLICSSLKCELWHFLEIKLFCSVFVLGVGLLNTSAEIRKSANGRVQNFALMR